MNSDFGEAPDCADVVSPQPQPLIDHTRANCARVWNCLLGGSDHYPVDEQLCGRILQAMPEMATTARHCRYFLVRALRYLAGELGIRQFLDLGAGLASVEDGSTHQMALRWAETVRVAYVDSDPLVLTIGRALVTAQSPATVSWIGADLHDPDTIVRQASHTLDLHQPVAVLAIATLEFLADPHRIVSRLMSVMPPGSALVVAQLTGGVDGGRIEDAAGVWNSAAHPFLTLRPPKQIDLLFHCLDVAEPGVVPVPRWRPDPWGDPSALPCYGGVGVKPAC